MKIFLKFLISQITFILILVGCFQNDTSITKVKVLIYGGWSMDYYSLININEDGSVEYILCDIDYEMNISDENFVKEIYEKKTIRLSKKNKVIVNELIQKTLENEPIEEVCDFDAIEIKAIIEDKEYRSLYLGDDYDYYYDKNLGNLCYKLVELSPLKLRSKMNPLRVPDEYK